MYINVYESVDLIIALFYPKQATPNSKARKWMTMLKHLYLFKFRLV